MNTKVKKEDLKKALEYIERHSLSEWISITLDTTNARLFLRFQDVNKQDAEIQLYPASNNVTPKLKVTTNLYRDTK